MMIAVEPMSSSATAFGLVLHTKIRYKSDVGTRKVEHEPNRGAVCQLCSRAIVVTWSSRVVMQTPVY